MPKETIASRVILSGILISSIAFGSAAPTVFARTKHRKTHATTTTSIATTPTTTTTTTTTPVVTKTNIIPLTWQTIYDGYGTVSWNSNFTQLTMSPKAATQPGETHAALVVSNQTLQQPYQLTYTMKTTKQLRTGSTPNPWEVAWGLFGYKPDGKFKYFTLKPNGFELGESLLNLAQNFLYTSSDAFPINTDYNVDMKVANNIVTIKVNGKQYLQYSMSSKDQLTTDGKFGFYTEDAAVKFSNIVARQL